MIDAQTLTAKLLPTDPEYLATQDKISLEETLTGQSLPWLYSISYRQNGQWFHNFTCRQSRLRVLNIPASEGWEP